MLTRLCRLGERFFLTLARRNMVVMDLSTSRSDDALAQRIHSFIHSLLLHAQRFPNGRHGFDDEEAIICGVFKRLNDVRPPGQSRWEIEANRPARQLVHRLLDTLLAGQVAALRLQAAELGWLIALLSLPAPRRCLLRPPRRTSSTAPRSGKSHGPSSSG